MSPAVSATAAPKTPAPEATPKPSEGGPAPDVKDAPQPMPGTSDKDPFALRYANTLPSGRLITGAGPKGAIDGVRVSWAEPSRFGATYHDVKVDMKREDNVGEYATWRQIGPWKMGQSTTPITQDARGAAELLMTSVEESGIRNIHDTPMWNWNAISGKGKADVTVLYQGTAEVPSSLHRYGSALDPTSPNEIPTVVLATRRFVDDAMQAMSAPKPAAAEKTDVAPATPAPDGEAPPAAGPDAPPPAG